MIILNNDEISAVLSMDNCLRFLERAYLEQARETAVNRPRSDMYLPATTSGGVYCFKTMEGALTQEKVVALRLNSGRSSGGKKRAGGSSKTRYRQRRVTSGSVSICYSPPKAANLWQSFLMGLSKDFEWRRAARWRPDSWRGRMRAFSGYLVPVGRRGLMQGQCARSRAIKKILVHSPTKSDRENFATEIEKELGIPWRRFYPGNQSPIARTFWWQRPIRYLEGAAGLAEARHAVYLREDYGARRRDIQEGRSSGHSCAEIRPDNYIAGYGDEKIECHDPIDLLTEGSKGSNVTPKQPFWLGAPELKGCAIREGSRPAIGERDHLFQQQYWTGDSIRRHRQSGLR